MEKFAHTKFLYFILALIHMIMSYVFFAKVIKNTSTSHDFEYAYGIILLIFGCFSIIVGPIVMSGNR